MTGFDQTVISTRIRLARNLCGYPPAARISAAKAREISKNVYRAVGSGFMLYELRSISDVEAGALVEQHLVSKELLGSKNAAVIVSDDDRLSVMLHEEDHVREQAIVSGYDLDHAFMLVSRLDETIAAHNRFEFSEKLGYITACRTNYGTGMRASVMMFLPALTLCDGVAACITRDHAEHITLRGVYGEGSRASGYIYQVSNQRTTDLSARQILNLVGDVVTQLTQAELSARERLFATRARELEDEIMRAYGIATHATLMSDGELIKLVAHLKLGVYFGFLKTYDVTALDRLVTMAHPYSLISSAECRLASESECDAYRASIVRSRVRELIFF